ncbi:MAG: DUF882 domain-containing protein [Cyanothece sp. SIO1E1]|nr:DUF882 domain-containing protein [Cyanothece sp. SIO1E1]
MKVKVVSDTIFKQSTKQSREVPASQKVMVEEGTEYDIHSHEPARNNHVKVALDNAALGPENKNTWFVYRTHVDIEGNEPENNPSDEEDAPQPRRDGIRLPGYRSTFYLSDPILKGGNFTWAEATKNGTRIPTSKSIVQYILRIADTMQDVREVLGNRPITVTSWYRDPVTNRRIGGARRSRHLTGGAVDFKVSGMPPSEVQRRLNRWWGSRGGLASARTFTHIDNRGYRARWRYGR